jgi:CDP-diacylglycerol--serine O-phosphatidyltransferase
MRLRPFPASRRPRVRAVQVLPTLITAGNLLAGVLALSYLQDAARTADPARAEALWAKAAWMVFLGMFCDGLDGRIARMTRTSSPFGAQLDSLADVITFGLTPALLMKSLVTASFSASLAPKIVLTLAVVYVLGAALRLARYNVESTRTQASEEKHVTMVFRGLPSPAAAGVVASLVLLRHEYALHWLDWCVLLGTPVLGLLMVSRMPYAHLLNRWFDGSRPFLTVVTLAVTGLLSVLYFQETVAVLFVLYAASGPVVAVVARLTGYPRWAEQEDEDEARLEDASPEPAAEEVEEPAGRGAPGGGEGPSTFRRRAP